MSGKYIFPSFFGNFLPLSGGTVTGDSVFTEKLSADTITTENLTVKSGTVSSSNVYETNELTFVNTTGDYFGKLSTPRTGTLTLDISSAVTGGNVIVYYQNETLDLPFTPINVPDFSPNQLCKLYIERDVDNNYTVNVIAVTV